MTAFASRTVTASWYVLERRTESAAWLKETVATAAGGTVIATNHAASVDADGWVEVLRRSAEKSGRPLEQVEILVPDEDFPTRDGRPPLKIAVCRRSR